MQMQIKSQFNFFIILLVFISHSAQSTYASSNIAGIPSQTATMTIVANTATTITGIVVVSLVVGNLVSFMFGAYPKSYDEIPLDNEEKEVVEEMKELIQSSVGSSGLEEINVSLGEIYTQHNYFDEGKEYLESALTENPNNPIGLAWLGVNEAKQASQMFDWYSMGAHKIHLVGVAIDKINRSVEIAPKNIILRIIRLSTFSSIGFSKLKDKVNTDLEFLLSASKEEENSPNLLKSFYSAIIRGQFYLYNKSETESKKQNVAKIALKYYELYSSFVATSNLDVRDKQELSEMIKALETDTKS